MKELPLSILNTKELYTTSARMHKIFCTSAPEDAFMKEMCNNLLTANTDMEMALSKSLSSDFTNVLLLEDEQRDNSYLGALDFVNAFTRSKNADLAGAAMKVSSVFQTIGRVPSLGYMAETAKLNTLISELEKPGINEAIDAIGARPWIDELKAAQEKFEKTYRDKTETESKINFPLVKDAKARIVKYLKALLNYVEMNSEELKKEQFVKAAQQLDEISVDVVTIARARKTRVENNRKNGENNAPDPVK